MFDSDEPSTRLDSLGLLGFHAFIAALTSFLAAIAAALLGMEGNIGLLAAVGVVSMLSGSFMARLADGSKAAWSWIPSALWFAGWVIPSLFDAGETHFRRTFIGDGYCGDFACMGQILVTAPFVGSVVYACAASLAAKDRSRSRLAPGPDHGPGTD